MRASAYLLRGVRSNRGRYALGASTVVVSTMIMVAMGVVFVGGQAELRSFFERAYAYDFEVAAARTESGAAYINVSSTLEGVLGVEGVEEAHPILATVLFTPPSEKRGAGPLLVYGTSPAYTAGRRKSMEGSYDLSPGRAVLSKKAAAKLGLGPGDALSLRNLLGQDYAELNATVSGVVELEGRFPPGVEEYAILGIDYLSDALNLTGRATSIVVLIDPSLYDLDSPSDPVGRAFDVGSRIALGLGPGYTVTSMKGLIIKQSVQGTSFFGVMVYVFSVFFPAVAGMMVASVLNLSVEDKAHDLAMLRLLGARRATVGRIVLLELALLLALGLPLGIALGASLPFLLAGGIMGGAKPASIASTAALQTLISVGVLLLFALKPLQRALRSSPVDAVRRARPLGALRFQREEGIDRRIPLSGLIVFVAVTYSTVAIPYILIFSSGMEILFYLLVSVLVMLVCLSVAALGLSTRLETAMVSAAAPFSAKVNRLARRSVVRYARRNLSTNVIFGVVVAILIFFSSLMSTVRGSIEDTARYESGADIRVRSAYDMPQSLLDSLAETPGVSDAAGVGPPVEIELGALVGPSREKATLYAADARLASASYMSRADFHQGGPEAFDLGNGSIVLSRTLATALGVERGDAVSASRDGRRSLLTVAAVLNTLPGFPYEVSQTGRVSDGSQAAFVSFEQHRYLSNESATSRRYSSVFLRVAGGRSAEKVGEEVMARLGDQEGVRVSVTKTNVREVVEATSFLDVIFSAVLLGMMMVAVFSLMSSLYASIKEREFELGVLRAVGFRRSHVLLSLLLEGLAVALGAVLLGVLVGLVVGYIMVWFLGLLSVIGLRFVLPWSVMGLALVAALVSSAMGVALTARYVTRRELIDLIRRAE
ncbi:MAG: ABC transporter permease [Thermoplasmatota archaeon]